MGIKNFMKKVYRKIFPRKKELPTRYFRIDGFNIDLGITGHTLPICMRHHPMYDRFVPYLGKICEEMKSKNGGGVLIDVGANVGDTVAGLIKHTSGKVICVEPTQIFYDLCKQNIKNFGQNFSERISLVKAYIGGNEADIYRSEIHNGTAVKIKSETSAEAPTYTLPKLFSLQNILLDDVSLIKTDTDGYDAECIMSLGDKAKVLEAVLYWENEIDNLDQLDQYIKMTNFLSESGYKTFFVFDNFGNFLCETDKKGMNDINMYLGRIMKKNSARTFYYVDVLAAKEDEKELCENVISEYLKSYEPA